MKDIKVIYAPEYKDLKPRETLVNGKEVEVLVDRDGKEYFMAKKDMILTVSEERAKYLVENRKLAEYIDGIEELKDAADKAEEDMDNIIKDNADDNQEVITINENDIANIDLVNEVPEGETLVDGVEIVKDKENELETADKVIDDMETADKKINKVVKNKNKKDKE